MAPLLWYTTACLQQVRLQEIHGLPDDRPRFLRVVQDVEIVPAFGIVDVGQRDSQSHRFPDEVIGCFFHLRMDFLADTDDKEGDILRYLLDPFYAIPVESISFRRSRYDVRVPCIRRCQNRIIKDRAPDPWNRITALHNAVLKGDQEAKHLALQGISEADAESKRLGEAFQDRINPHLDPEILTDQLRKRG